MTARCNTELDQDGTTHACRAAFGRRFLCALPRGGRSVRLVLPLFRPITMRSSFRLPFIVALHHFFTSSLHALIVIAFVGPLSLFPCKACAAGWRGCIDSCRCKRAVSQCCNYGWRPGVAELDHRRLAMAEGIYTRVDRCTFAVRGRSHHCLRRGVSRPTVGPKFWHSIVGAVLLKD